MAKQRLNQGTFPAGSIKKTHVLVGVHHPELHKVPEMRARRQHVPVRILGVGEGLGMLTGRLPLRNRLDFASGGRLQQDEAVACGFFRVQVALAFVLNLQAGPFGFGISRWFGVSAGAYGSPDGRCLALVQRRSDFTLRRMARASGK